MFGCVHVGGILRSCCLLSLIGLPLRCCHCFQSKVWTCCLECLLFCFINGNVYVLRECVCFAGYASCMYILLFKCLNARASVGLIKRKYGLLSLSCAKKKQGKTTLISRFQSSNPPWLRLFQCFGLLVIKCFVIARNSEILTTHGSFDYHRR